MKVNIEIEVTDIEVSDEYYSFNYTIRGKGLIDAEGSYEDDYENGMSAKEWKEVLEEGEAYVLAIQAEF